MLDSQQSTINSRAILDFRLEILDWRIDEAGEPETNCLIVNNQQSTIFGKIGVCSSDKSLKLNKKIVKLDRALRLIT
ncbi:hypothetical protein [Microcoleus sp. D2_18a_B4]|uniref:hypothetical protein n=1 Tax=Microcoleus sp. D2_18a_B4 TaxID=3055329 RepID=UPI002FD4B7F4